MGRFQRFYPDFFISSILSFVLQANPFVGCWAISGLNWMFNFASLFLLGAWLIWIPGTGYLNGPAWFIVTLAWLWIGFPFFQPQLAAFCRSDSHWQFVLKVLVLWALSILPWVLLLILSPYSIFATFGDLVWGMKRCPPFRVAEFVIGVLVAVRVQERNEYAPIGDSNKKDDGSTTAEPLDPAGPLTGLIASCAALLAAALAFHVAYATQWDTACACLDLSPRCYGWFQFIDSRFAPAAAALIFTAASLDCAVAAEGGGDSDARIGWLGAAVRRGMTFGPIIEVLRAPHSFHTAGFDPPRALPLTFSGCRAIFPQLDSRLVAGSGSWERAATRAATLPRSVQEGHSHGPHGRSVWRSSIRCAHSALAPDSRRDVRDGG